MGSGQTDKIWVILRSLRDREERAALILESRSNE